MKNIKKFFELFDTASLKVHHAGISDIDTKELVKNIRPTERDEVSKIIDKIVNLFPVFVYPLGRKENCRFGVGPMNSLLFEFKNNDWIVNLLLKEFNDDKYLVNISYKNPDTEVDPDNIIMVDGDYDDKLDKSLFIIENYNGIPWNEVEKIIRKRFIPLLNYFGFKKLVENTPINIKSN